MCGVLTTNSEDLNEKLLELRFYGGLNLSPYPAWLVRRSLQTFKLRIEHQSLTTKALSKKLIEVPFIKKIYYPNIDGHQLTGYGGIIFIEVDDSIVTHYDQILKRLRFFGTGTGMVCVTSMIAQPYTGSHASLTESEKKMKWALKEIFYVFVLDLNRVMIYSKISCRRLPLISRDLFAKTTFDSAQSKKRTAIDISY